MVSLMFKYDLNQVLHAKGQNRVILLILEEQNIRIFTGIESIDK